MRTPVFAQEEEAREQQMSPAARLRAHQEARRPRLEDRKRWLDTQRDERLVDPNRALGKAMASMQGHGATRTRFLEGAGAPREPHVV